MDSSRTLILIEQLDDDIDDLEDSLAPMLKNVLSAMSSKLPVLDKAKLYITITYAIESILFSYLRLHGVKAREHPIYKELTRVRQYFEKIKDVENPNASRPTANLDKKAAARFVKAALVGNDRYDLERAKRKEGDTAELRMKPGEVQMVDDEDSTSEADTNTGQSSPHSGHANMTSSKRSTSSEEKKSSDSGPGSFVSPIGSDSALPGEKRKRSKGEGQKTKRQKARKRSA